MAGVNDLLRGGRSADAVFAQLKLVFGKWLAAGANVIAIPPLGTPGFVK